jgi:CrcB protein
MLSALWIFVGSGLGGVARWGASGFIAERFGQTFPWGTLVVNVTGSFIIGLFATLTGPEGRFLAPASFRQFSMLGVCGGYTTFSSFSLQTLNLADEGEWFRAGGNAVLSRWSCACWASGSATPSPWPSAQREVPDICTCPTKRCC